MIVNNKKLHTCEESRAHLRIYFLAFIDELEKEIIIKKIVKVDQKKINIYNVAFLKKIYKEKHL